MGIWDTYSSVSQQKNLPRKQNEAKLQAWRTSSMNHQFVPTFEDEITLIF